MIKDLQQKIIDEKNKRGVAILAHSYMSEQVCEVADFVGDSYALAVKAKDLRAQTVIMCGVRFMAETVKMLSPKKRVILSHPEAGCPMAEQFSREEIEEVKKLYPDYAVVAYINTTAELKTVADVCVTSSSALKICRALPQKNILFIPDINLGSYVRDNLPEKNFKLLSGGCPTHAKFEREHALAAKAAHPEALLLAHPECRPEIVKIADFVGSTAAIMEFAKKSDGKEFIIATENSIAEHLRFSCPDKKFYTMSKDFVCHNMRLTTLFDVYDAITGTGGEEINLEESLRLAAVKSIEKMIELGG